MPAIWLYFQRTDPVHVALSASWACMHVSMLAGLLPTMLPTSSAYSEHKARVAAPFHQLCRGEVVGAALGAALKAWLQLNG